MKVLVKNIRHINESIFQNMFYKSFGIHNKQELNESIETPSGAEIEGWHYSNRNNIATYFNKGIYIGSAIMRDSKTIPVPSESQGLRLTYPYVPIIGYGITPLEYITGVSTTGIRKSGIDKNEDAQVAFAQALSSNNPNIIPPSGIILGWQQNIKDKDTEQKNTMVNPLDRNSTWGKVGNALAYQQICSIKNDELVFDGSKIEPIYGTQQIPGSNIKNVQLVPLDIDALNRFIGGEKQKIINGKIMHIVSVITKQFNGFDTNDKAELKFLTHTPISGTNRVDNEHKQNLQKMYKEVFDIIIKYLVEQFDTANADNIKKEYEYMKSVMDNTVKQDLYTVDQILNWIKGNLKGFVKAFSNLPSEKNIDLLKSKYLQKINATDNPRKRLGDELTSLFEKEFGTYITNKGIETVHNKSCIDRIIKYIHVEGDDSKFSKEQITTINADIHTIAKLENKDSLYKYIADSYGKDKFIVNLYFSPNEKYYYWKHVDSIPDDRKKVLDKLLHYDNAIGDSGAHKDGATLSEKGAGGFRNISGSTLGEKFMNACIRAFDNTTKSYTFTINRNDASSMFGDKITSKRGNYRAFIVFDNVTDSNIVYDYNKMFSDIEDQEKSNDKTIPKFKLIPNFTKLPQTLTTKRLEGKIYFLELNPAVEYKTNTHNNSPRITYGRYKADHSAIYSVDNETMKLIPTNQIIGFSVLLVNNNDNYFFFCDYDSDFFNRVNAGRTDIDTKEVTIKHRTPLTWVSGSDKNNDRSASQMNYGSLNGTTWKNVILNTIMSKNELIDIDKNSNVAVDIEDVDNREPDDEKRKITTSIVDVNQEQE